MGFWTNNFWTPGFWRDNFWSGLSSGAATDRFYGINKGGMNPKDVREAGSTTNSGVEVHIDLSKPFMTDKLIVCECVREVKRYLQSIAKFPP